MSSSPVYPESSGPKEFLDLVASRLGRDGFSVQRGVRVDPYSLDTLASRTIMGTTLKNIKVQWSNIVAVSFIDAPSRDVARDYSGFIAKYAYENRKSFSVPRNGQATIAVMVSLGFMVDTKRWVSETSPNYSWMWANSEFPVLVELTSHEISYYRGTPFRNYGLYESCESFRTSGLDSQTLFKFLDFGAAERVRTSSRAV